MITFNDKVHVDVSFLQNSTGMYEWKVYELNPINENDTTEYTTTEVEIFIGTAFFVKKPGSGAIFVSKQFDITSIVNQRKWYMRNLETLQNGRVNLVNRYIIEVASGNNTYRSEIITVCFYHPYGNYTNIMDPYEGYVDYDEYQDWYAMLAPLIQGAKEINTGILPEFLPKIPRETAMTLSDAFVYPIVGLCSKSYHNKNIQLDCTGEMTVSRPGPIGRYVPYYINEYAPAWLHKFSLRQIRYRGAFRPTDENVIANFVETGRHNFNEQWVDTPSNEYVWTMDNATLTYRFSTYFKSGNNYSYIGTAANISPNQRLEGTLWIELRHLNFIKRHTEPTTFTIMLHASEYDPDTDDDIDYNDYIEFDASWLKDIVLENNETISMPFELSYGTNSYLKFGASYHHYLKPEGEGNYLVAKINDSGAMIANLDDYNDCTVEAQEYTWIATTNWEWTDTYNVVLTAEFPGVGEIEIELGSNLGNDFIIHTSNYKYLIERLFRVYGTPTQSTNYYLSIRPFDEILGHDWYISFDVNNYIEDWVTYGCDIECNTKVVDGKTYLTIQIQHTDNIMTAKIAEIKDCIKYYLMWQDRAGGFQCQPFEKTETYSEDFSRVQWETYNNAKRLASVDVQPQWKLNTGFIDDKYYPYYESIFVSPYIELWDIEKGTKRRVYVEDTKYTEKTFKNLGRQLFNLELTVKEDTKQHILY